MLTNIEVAESADQKITAAWWDEFLLKCKNFTETIVIPDVLSDSDCSDMTTMTLDAVREICNRQAGNYDFRFYLGTENMDDEYLKKNIYPFPPLPGETLTTWADRVFPGLKFGIILNYGEKFSPLMAETIGRYASPLLEKIGIPVNGTCITIFIGNYGYTPLGIHQDHKGENVIHFHLGPGGKIMYNWEVEEFKELGGHQNFMDVEKMVPYATKFPFKKGDIFYMPWNKFHIGYSDELSIGVSLWFNNITRKKMMNKLINSIQLQYTDQEDKTITKPEKDITNLQGFKEIEGLIKYDTDIQHLTVEQFFKHTYKEYMRALYSNGGWRARPLSLEQEVNYNENEYEHLRGALVQRVPPFVFHYTVSPDNSKLFVYCRASKIEINYHPELINIIEQLNSGERFVTNDLVAGLAKEWPEEAGLYFLSLLYNKRGIQIID
jgi:hypothetical protein